MQLMVPLRVQPETAFCSLSYFRHILKPYETELKQSPKLARLRSGWGWVGLEQVGMELDPVRFDVDEPCFYPRSVLSWSVWAWFILPWFVSPYAIFFRPSF